jgi:primosomal protein N' (replication factor Y)
VPLHGRSVRGWIVGAGHESIAEAKQIKSSLGFGPTREVVDLARWASWRWAGTWARFLATASPETIVRTLPSVPKLRPLSIPSTPLARIGDACAANSGPQLVRLGPATDPFDLVLGFLSGVHRSEDLRADPALAGSVIILVPGRGYASRLVARLSRRGIAAVDAGTDWAAARAGWPVVVGTRAGALAPVPALTGMMILDAEDERFYSESAPTWNVAELARHRCQGGTPLVLVSSCPGAVVLEGAASVQTDGLIESEGWPAISVVDLRQEDPRTGILSRVLVDLGRAALEASPDGVAIACIVNRKGRARLVACGRCDNVARCVTCDSACILDERLVCPRCGEQRPVICTACGATSMKLLRLGTAQLAADCQALFGVPTVEMTASSPSDVLDGARIVVGTEAVLHRVRSARLVAFLDLDHHLLAPRAGAELRALAMVGRAGRLVGGRGAMTSGRVLVQTRLAEHPVLIAAASGDPTGVIESDGEVRRLLGLAPYGAIARIRGPGARLYAGELAEDELEISELDVDDFVVKASGAVELADALARASRPKEAVRVAVDPESI